MKSSGIALVMTLLLLVVLVVLVGQFSYTTKIDAYIADNTNNEIQIRYGLLSGVNFAIAQLQLDAMKEEGSKTKYDCTTDEWAQSLWPPDKPQKIGNVLVFYSIQDESAKFNLLRLIWKKKEAEEKKKEDKDKEGQEGEEGQKKEEEQDKEQDKGKDKDKPKEKPKAISPEQQFDLLGKIIQGEKAAFDPAKLRESIVAWMKQKKGKSEKTTGSFPTKVPMFSMKELSMAGIMPYSFLSGRLDEKGNRIKGFSEYTTIWSDGDINVNTASVELLQSLSPKMNAELIKGIISYREQAGPDGERQVFKQKTDLKKVQGLSDGIYSEIESLVDVRSSYFLIEAMATAGRSKKKLSVVVYREGKKVYKLWSDYTN
ncbi:MAG: general secretion pathway protein GspK [Candidatus Brocadiae bacterium]|nr:general secretion pathway protein GspK [Candidatus Brocadiia bacterium]